MGKKEPLKKVLKKDFLLLTLFPVAIFVFIFILYLLSYVNNKEETEQKMMFKIIEGEVQQVFSRNLILLKEIKSTLDHDFINKESINLYLDNFTANHDIFESIRIVNKQGDIIYAPTKEKDIIGFNVSYQDYYESVKEHKGDYWSKVFISAESSKATMAVSLNDNEENLIIGYYSLKELQAILDKIPIKQNHNISIVNFQGNFIAHSDFDKVVKRENEKHYEQIQKDGNYVLNDQNKKLLVSTLSVPDQGFAIIIYKPFFDSYGIVIQLCIFSFLLFACIILITGIMANKKTQPLINTISELILQTSKISQGNYEKVFIKTNILEFNELQENFNSMSGVIQEMFSGLTDSQMELEILNEDLENQNDEIRRNEEQISSIINSIYDGIMVFDSKFNILWINDIALKLFNIKREKVQQGTKCYNLLFGNSSRCFNCEVDIVKLGQNKMTSVMNYEDKIIEETFIPIFNELNEFDGVIKTYRDITDKTVIETKLNKAVKMEAIGRLTGGIAHDFNNILQVIIGYSDLVMIQMKETEENREILAKIQSIYNTALKAEKLIKKLMTFSKIDQTTPINLNVNLIVKETTSMLTTIIGDNIELILDLDQTIPDIFADPTQIEQIIMNLCINSKDSMASGGEIRIHTKNKEKNKVEYVCLEIIDTGSGIPNNIKEKVFEPFFTTKEMGKGTGLGLPIVLGIVEKLKGLIELDTEDGKGTHISIYLPKSKSMKLDSIKTDYEIHQKDLTGLRILLAEDNDSVRSIASIVLRSKGVHLIEAKNGKEALKEYINFEGKINILILDIIMPEMNGLVVYEKIKLIDPSIKAIFTTGYNNDFLGEDYNLYLEGKILEKPYKNEELIQAIIEVLQ